MSDFDRLRLRQAFKRPPYLSAKVTPQGFEVEDSLFDELRGRITKVTLTRKLFDDGYPVCSSPDGVKAADGTLCDECKHPNCQPKLRTQLASDTAIFTLELALTSAQNLFALEDKVEAAGQRLVDWIVKLKIIDHDHWGEVVFEPLQLTPSRGSSEPPS